MPCVCPTLAGFGVLAGAAAAQTITPIARTGSVSATAYTQSQTQNLSSLTSGRVGVSATSPGDVLYAGAFGAADSEASVFPTSLRVAVSGSVNRGSVPMGGYPTGAAGTAQDAWTVAISDTTCFTLDYAMFMSVDPVAATDAQYVSFSNIGSGSITLANGTQPYVISTTITNSGAPSLHYEGTLGAGNYLVQVFGVGGNPNSPGITDFSHHLTLTLGPPAQLGQIASALACPSHPVTFALPADGGGSGGSASGLTYLWQWRPLGSSTWTDMVSGVNVTPGTNQPAFEASGATQVSVTMTNSVGNSSVVTGGRREVHVIVANTCGPATSSAATWTICPADYNCSGQLEVADIFAFLNAWFAGNPSSDFDGVNGLQVADIFVFLNAWFAGC